MNNFSRKFMNPNNMKENNKTNKLTNVLFIIYLIALFWILLFKLGVRFSYMEKRNVNLIPFAKIDVAEIILNVVIFVPLGIYAGVSLERWGFVKKLFFFFKISFFWNCKCCWCRPTVF